MEVGSNKMKLFQRCRKKKKTNKKRTRRMEMQRREKIQKEIDYRK